MVYFSYILAWSALDQVNGQGYGPGSWGLTGDSIPKDLSMGQVAKLYQIASSIKGKVIVIVHYITEWLRCLNAFVKHLEGCLADGKPPIGISYHGLHGSDSCINIYSKGAQTSA